jgi:uncharacterized protein YcfJ
MRHPCIINHAAVTLMFSASVMLLTPPLLSQQTNQEIHDRAKAEQDAHDRAHHNTAKTVGGTAAGGAVVGALAGGGKGALIGGAAGAGVGVVADKVRKHHGVKKRERAIARHSR